MRRRWAFRLAATLLLVTIALGARPDAPPAIAAASPQYFEATGHTLAEPFASAYVRLGGLERFGYPRTEAIIEAGRTVQYFQRAVMEHWPEHAGTRYEVQLRLLGYQAAEQEPDRPEWRPLGRDRVSAGARYFPETQHSIGQPFLAEFDRQGGIDGFGYPISEAFDRGGIRVQYFQRARFEHHPANPKAYQVQLGLLADELIARTWAPTDPRLARVARPTPSTFAWGEGSIRISGGEVSRYNAAIAVERVNGYVLKPGARFSFDDVARSWDGEEDPIYRWSSATSCEGGLIPMRGGGVCYVSTAIWRAWMVAGLRTVTRVAHAGLLDDFGAGFDAANTLVVENDSSATLRLIVTYDGVDITARVVGDQPPDRKATLRGPRRLSEGEYVLERLVEFADGRRTSAVFRSSYCW